MFPKKSKIKMTKGRQKNTYKIWILQITFQTTCLNGVANCKELSRNTDLVPRLCKQSRASDTFPAPPSVTHLSQLCPTGSTTRSQYYGDILVAPIQAP